MEPTRPELTPSAGGERWELVRLARSAGRHFRWGVRLVAVGLVVLLAAQLASVYRLFYDLHPWAGFAAAAVFAGLLIWLLVWPIVRLARVPRAVDPPLLPPLAERGPEHVRRQLRYLRRYLGCMENNPHLSEHRAAVDASLARLTELQRELDGLAAAEANTRIDAFERDSVLPLLAPLDKQVDALIRKEALAIGTLTALSHMGTVDAFLVLWRHINLVAAVSRIYYGRPGVRGTWHIVRDVASAILLSSVLEQLSQMGTGVVRKMGEGGRTLPLVGAIVGPMLDGTINAIVAMKIGYLAKERCRSFQAWDPQTTQGILKTTFKRVGDSASVVAEELQVTLSRSMGVVRASADLGKEALAGFSNRTVDMLRGIRRGWKGEPGSS